MSEPSDDCGFSSSSDWGPGYYVPDMSTVTYLIDHLFFPARIDTSKPVEDDGINTSKSELNLLSFVHKAVTQFCSSGILTSPSALTQMERIVKMLGVMARLQNLPPEPDKLQAVLMKTFERMEEGGMYNVVAVVLVIIL